MTMYRDYEWEFDDPKLYEAINEQNEKESEENV
jgi:hypothetical protein